MDAGYFWKWVECNMYTLVESSPYAVQENLALNYIAKKAVCLSCLEYCTVFASWIKPIEFLWTESFWQQSLNYEWQEPFSSFLTSNLWCITQPSFEDKRLVSYWLGFKLHFIVLKSICHFFFSSGARYSVMYEIFDLHVAVRLDFGKHSAAKLKWYLVKTFQKIMILQLPYW